MNISDCILSLVFSINQKGFLQNYLISVVLQCYDVSITHIMLQCTNCTAHKLGYSKFKIISCSQDKMPSMSD